MKVFKFTLLMVSALLLCSCDNIINGEPVAYKTYGKMGYHSILNYRYMRYTGDSAVLIMRVVEIDNPMRHYNKSSIYMGQQLVANSDSLPFEVEIPIPIMDDSVFHIRHICRIDSLPNYSDTLEHLAYVHKSEIVNPTPDTVSLVCERLDSVVLRTYYTDSSRFWWLRY